MSISIYESFLLFRVSFVKNRFLLYNHQSYLNIYGIPVAIGGAFVFAMELPEVLFKYFSLFIDGHRKPR